MQTFFLVADDIMDGAETRRGKQCWYKKDNIGMMAFNDAIILETCIYSVLNRHLKDHKHYNTFVDAFLQVNLRAPRRSNKVPGIILRINILYNNFITPQILHF